MLAALEHLEHERTTVACNKFYARRPADLAELERRLRERRLHRSVAIPHDRQLATMLDSGTYELDALERTTRTGAEAARARGGRTARLMRARANARGWPRRERRSPRWPLVAAALAGAAIASRGPDVPADAQRRMERAERQVVRSQRALSDSEVEAERLRRGLVSARRQARRVARDNARVENELRQLRGASPAPNPRSRAIPR